MFLLQNSIKIMELSNNLQLIHSEIPLGEDGRNNPINIPS